MLLQVLRRGWRSLLRDGHSQRRATGRWEISTLPALVDVLEDRTLLSAILVTNLADSGAGSLRAAVATANANPGADVIRFQGNLAGTIVLTSGQMEITDALTIDGPGAARLTISGNNASRVFKMGPGTQLAIDDLTIANATNTTHDDIGILVSRGGAILNDGGNLTLTRMTFRNNQTIDTGTAPGASAVVGGGAVVNSGSAHLMATNCLFVGNTASGGLNYAFGGAIGNVTNSMAVIENCKFIDNVATAGATSYGGAIGNFGSSQLTVTNCTFEGNTARGTDPGEKAFGGAIATRPGTVVSSGSTTTIDRSWFFNNRAIGGAGAGQAGGAAGGGALYNVESTLIAGRSRFVGNQAVGGNGTSGGNAFGGAIEATAVNPAAPPVTNIEGSQFFCNQAIAGKSDGGTSALAAGGALFNAFGQMDLARSSIVGNAARGRQGQGIGGGIYNLATLTTDKRTRRSICWNSASTSHNNVYNA